MIASTVLLTAHHLYFLKCLLLARQNFTTAHAHKNKCTACRLTNAHRDHLIPLIYLYDRNKCNGTSLCKLGLITGTMDLNISIVISTRGILCKWNNKNVKRTNHRFLCTINPSKTVHFSNFNLNFLTLTKEHACTLLHW